MEEPGYSTPEEAAAGGIPPRYVQVMGVSVHGDDAIVGFLTNDPPAQEPYVSTSHRRGGRWHAGSGSGGYGWGWHYGDANVAYRFEPVPADVAEVVVTHADRRVRSKIVGGHLFVAFWGVDPDENEWISVEQIVTADGVTRDAEPGWPSTPAEFRAQERLREFARDHADRLLRGDDGIGVNEIHWLDE